MVYQGTGFSAILEIRRRDATKVNGGENDDFVFIWMMIYDI